VILFSGINSRGEKTHRLFSSFSALNSHLVSEKVTLLSKKRVSFSSHSKTDKLLLTLLSQLRDNLSLSSSLTESLQHLAKHSPDPLCNAVFYFLYQNIQRGKGLHESFLEISIPFSSQCMQLIQQGERTNQLTAALTAIIDHLTKKEAQKKEIKKKLVYPALLLFSTVVFFHFLVLALFPSMLSLYASLGKQAPTWLQSLSSWKGLLFVLDCFIILAVLLSADTGLFNFKRRVYRLLGRMPFLQTLPMLSSRLQWLCVFSLQYSAGVSLPGSFQQATQACKHDRLKLALKQAYQKIKNGVAPSHTLSHNSLFPPDWVLTFQLGERNNNLGILCKKLIEKEKSLLLSKINFLIALIEPLTLLILGSCILFLILALYAPLLSAYSTPAA
jgi:type II secretory pathway component PulF